MTNLEFAVFALCIVAIAITIASVLIIRQEIKGIHLNISALWSELAMLKDRRKESK